MNAAANILLMGMSSPFRPDPMKSRKRAREESEVVENAKKCKPVVMATGASDPFRIATSEVECYADVPIVLKGLLITTIPL